MYILRGDLVLCSEDSGNMSNPSVAIEYKHLWCRTLKIMGGQSLKPQSKSNFDEASRVEAAFIKFLSQNINSHVDDAAWRTSNQQFVPPFEVDGRGKDVDEFDSHKLDGVTDAGRVNNMTEKFAEVPVFYLTVNGYQTGPGSDAQEFKDAARRFADLLKDVLHIHIHIYTYIYIYIYM